MSPSTLRNNGSAAKVRVAALVGDSIGSGSVSLTASIGSLDAKQLTLDGFGSAETSYLCDVTLKPECQGSARISAQWMNGAELVEASATVRLTDGMVMRPACDFGTARSTATTSTLDLFGQTVFFNNGAALPAGRYSLRYTDGCMKYASDQGWTIHAYADGRSAWWLVGATPSSTIVMPPGTVGFAAGSGAFSAFTDCVVANRALATKEFDFAGGVLGIWLRDMPYADNIVGEGGRNPSWQLTTVGCVP
ncbi:MAG: hypothetical protein JNJ54_21550 [Myxococcaceae bacterium]|nr:hypothetical protein [Myxococcaceae bacterium]